MKASALTLNVIGMSLFGLAALAGFAALVAVRTDRGGAAALSMSGTEQGAAAAPSSGAAAGPAGPLAVLAAGAAEQARAAAAGLANGRPPSRAIADLDAAHRAVRVAAQAAPPDTEVATLLDRARAHVEAARHAVAVGAPAHAGHLALAAATDLDRAAARSGQLVGRQPSPLQRYPGTTLIDTHGRRIGELLAIEGDRVRCRLGGAGDVFGLFDLGGREATVPIDRLVFGKAHRLRRAQVVLLPTAPLRRAAEVSPRRGRTVPAPRARARAAGPGA